ncbi:MAG: DNA repair protein RecO, partial [Nitrospiraceae bacterium]
MLIRTEGIVLKTQKYGEADLIVTFLTSDKGIINAFAKSPRKTKSRFGSSLEPLTHAKLSLWGKEQSLPKITQSDIIEPFHQIRENYNDYVSISKLVEILISLMPSGIPNKRLF